MLVFEDDLDFLKEQRRKTFLKNLVDEGVEIEIEHPDPTKRRVKTYCPIITKTCKLSQRRNNS